MVQGKKISLWNSMLKEVSSHKAVYFLLAAVLVLSTFVRVYRIDQLLGFYYDQGRDAHIIWDLWHKQKFFLIGPTTGIEGIYRGPWYYWLIAPFYLFGKGDPVWPSVFLSFTTVLAAFFAFLLGKKIQGYTSGLLAVLITGFSFNLVVASRWLSNPTPMFLISMLLVYSLFMIVDGRKIFWVAVGFLLGLSMQFGSAAEVFYFLGIVIFALWQRKSLPSKKIFLVSLIALFIVFLPQIYFDFKHDHVLLRAINKFLVEEKSFKASFWQLVQVRLPFYYDVFFSKLFITSKIWRDDFSIILTIISIILLPKIVRDKYLLTLVLMLASPLLGMLFFQGNYGNVYDYYFTGYYLIFILLVSSILGLFAKSALGKIVVLLFIVWFLSDNIPVEQSYVKAGVDGQDHITLGNELQAVNWVFEDSKKRGDFNVDVYVPPVIPHAYDYLFLWQGTKRCGVNLCNLKLDGQVPLLYTLFEVDPPHPERLKTWLARQKGIAQVESKTSFGGITIERRERTNNTKK